MEFLNYFFSNIIFTDIFHFLFSLVIVFMAIVCFIDLFNLF